LLTRAAEIAEARNRAAEASARADRRRREAEAAEGRKKRLAAVAARGESAWCEGDNEIELRNAASYDRAKALLTDLRDVALSQGKICEFERRVDALRQKHARKGQFIDRLRSLVKKTDQNGRRRPRLRSGLRAILNLRSYSNGFLSSHQLSF